MVDKFQVERCPSLQLHPMVDIPQAPRQPASYRGGFWSNRIIGVSGKRVNIRERVLYVQEKRATGIKLECPESPSKGTSNPYASCVVHVQNRF